MCVQSQTPVFRWNTPNTKPNLQIDEYMYGHPDKGLYIVNRIPPSGTDFNPSVTVEYFNTTLDRVFKKNLTVDPLEDDAGHAWLNGEIVLFKSLFAKDQGSNTLYATWVRPDGSLQKGRELARLPAEKLAQRGRFQVSSSPDGSKLVVLSEPNFEKDAQEVVKIAVYNASLEKLWSMDYPLPYEWTRAVNNRPLINNQGTVYLIKKTSGKGDESGYSLFATQGKKLQEHRIVMEGKRKVASMVNAFDEQGDLWVGGYFVEDAKIRAGIGTPYHGLYLNEVSASGENMPVAQVHPFEKRKDIVPRKLLFAPDQVILMGEYYFSSSTSAKPDPTKPMSEQDMFARDYSYTALDITADAFDRSGKPRFSTTVNKNNSSRNDFGSWVSYFSEILNGRLYLIFNDEEYRYAEKKKAVIFGGSPKIVVYATIDLTNGTASATKPVPQTGPVGGKDGEMLLRPEVQLKISDTQCLIRAENRDLYRLGTITF